MAKCGQLGDKRAHTDSTRGLNVCWVVSDVSAVGLGCPEAARSTAGHLGIPKQRTDAFTACRVAFTPKCGKPKPRARSFRNQRKANVASIRPSLRCPWTLERVSEIPPTLVCCNGILQTSIDGGEYEDSEDRASPGPRPHPLWLHVGFGPKTPVGRSGGADRPTGPPTGRLHKFQVRL